MSAYATPREQFLVQVLCTAVEGGTGYWAQVSQYQYEDDRGNTNVVVGDQDGYDTRAVLHPRRLDDRGYEPQGLTVTTGIVADGVGRVRRGEVAVSDVLRREILLADADRDAGLIDAECADVIVQAGLFGRIVYA